MHYYNLKMYGGMCERKCKGGHESIHFILKNKSFIYLML